MTKRWFALVLSVMMLISCLPLTVFAAEEEVDTNPSQITVDFSKTAGDMIPKTGWLLIPNEAVPDGRILPLNTQVVRDDIDTQNLLGNNGNSSSENNLQDWSPNEQNRLQRMKHGVERLAALGIPDYYPIMGYFSSWVSNDGKPRGVPSDYEAYGQWVKDIAQYSKDNNLPINKYNVWNEFWGINDAQFSRMYEEAWYAVREVDPSFELVGPSTDNPNLGSITRLADYCVEHNITLDNVAWHFGELNDVGNFQNQVDEYIQSYPTLGDPEYYYEEYLRGSQMVNLADNMTAFSVLDENEFTGAIRAIWSYVNGLSDQLTINYDKLNAYARRNIWWLMTAYASMSGTRILHQSDAPYIASYDEEKGEAKLLLGGTLSGRVRIDFTNTPFAGKAVRIDKYKLTEVENDGIRFQSSETLPVAGKDIATEVNFEGDIWMIVVKEQDSVPGDFALQNPDDGMAVAGLPIFTWQKAQGATAYDLVISESTDLSNPVVEVKDIATNSYTLTKSLSVGKDYYWQVTAKNAAGTRLPYGGMYHTFTMAEKDTVPGRFTMLQVIDEDPSVSLTPKFTWTPSYQATSYKIHISKDADFATETVIDVTQTVDYHAGQQNKYKGYTLTEDQKLDPQTKYYAYVSAVNADGERVMAGDPHEFTTTTADGTPAEFNVTAPANNTTVDPRFTFRWDITPGAFFYNLEIAKDPDFKDIVFSQDTITIGAYTMEENVLEPETTYYWRVTATDKQANEDAIHTPGTERRVNQNGVQSFTTSNKPTAPIMKVAVSATGGAVVHFNPINEADVYRVKYGITPGEYTHEVETTTPSAFLGLEPDVPYYCTVVAVRNGIESDASIEVEAVGYDTNLTVETDTPLEAEMFPTREGVSFYTGDNPSSGVAVEFKNAGGEIALTALDATGVTLQYQAVQDTKLSVYNGDTLIKELELYQTPAGKWSTVSLPVALAEGDILRIVKDGAGAVARVDYILLTTEEMAERGNLAPAATITVDSQMNGNYSNERVNDGLLAGDKDFWVAGNAPTEEAPNWALAALESASEVYKIEVALPPIGTWGARTQNIRVLTSEDGTKFTERTPRQDYTFNNATNNNRVTVFESDTPVKASYVKIEIYSNTGDTRGQIGELFIDGVASNGTTVTPPVVSDNLALGKPVEVEATYYGDPTNINDGNTSSFWDGGKGTFPNYAAINLNRPYTLDKIEISLPSGWGDRNQELELMTSMDGVNYTTLIAKEKYLFSKTENSNKLTFELEPAPVAQYVKVVGYSNDEAGQPGVQFSEIAVYGDYTPVTGVALVEDTLALEAGEKQTLTATIDPAAAEYRALSWSSSDVTVATVDETGKVTAVSEGTATIRVRTLDGNFIDTCTVTVTARTVRPGDVNENGSVTAEDALLALQIATNKVNPSESQLEAADVDGNGDVTANDALLILQYATKKISSL